MIDEESRWIESVMIDTILIERRKNNLFNSVQPKLSNCDWLCHTTSFLTLLVFTFIYLFFLYFEGRAKCSLTLISRYSQSHLRKIIFIFSYPLLHLVYFFLQQHWLSVVLHPEIYCNMLVKLELPTKDLSDKGRNLRLKNEYRSFQYIS